MIKDVVVGAAVMRSVLGDIRGNVARITELTEQAGRLHADFVCFPELSITGYDVTGEILREIAVERTSSIIGTVVELAHSCNITVLAGFAEREGENVYASHLVAAPDGLSGVYRKIHLGPPETGVFSAGNSLEIFSSEGIQFSIQLCYDAHFPELSTLHALKGAEIIFMPHASPRGTPQEKLAGWLRHLTARAYDNSVFIVALNLAGENGHGLEFPGVAAILSPSGKLLADLTGNSDTLLTAVLRKKDLLAVREHRMRYFLPNRRPELYTDLVKSGKAILRKET